MSIKNLCKGKSGSILRLWGGVLLFSITLYGLLCTVYSDIIVQNDNDFVKLPKKSLSKKAIEATLGDLIRKDDTNSTNSIYEKMKSREKKKNEENLYVFAIDISGSFLRRNISDRLYSNYKNRLKKLEKKFHNRVEINEEPDVLNFAKVRLYELLSDFYYNQEVFKEDKFAVWTLGNESTWEYPDQERKTEIKDSTLIGAIEKINELKINNPDDYTDFVKFFESLRFHYNTELKCRQKNIFESPSVIITFITDLIHDVDNKKSAGIDRNWEDLEKRVEQICNSKIMINLIVLSDVDLENQRSIFPLFRKNIEWHRLNKNSIADEKNTDFLFPVRFTENSIKFYYTNPNYISEAEFNIRFTSEVEDKIRISILGEDNSLILPRMSIYCEVSGSYQRKKVFSNGNCFEAVVQQNQKLKLTYNNRIPSSFSVPILKLTVVSKKMSFLIPIQFIKKLPKWAAKIFVVLQGLLIFSLVLSLVSIVILGILFVKSRRNYS